MKVAGQNSFNVGEGGGKKWSKMVDLLFFPLFWKHVPYKSYQINMILGLNSNTVREVTWSLGL